MSRFKPFACTIGVWAALAIVSTATAHYHPKLGRWIERDPIGYLDGSNVYSYAGDRPLRFTDLSGTKTFCCDSGVGHQIDHPSNDCDECCTKLCGSLKGTPDEKSPGISGCCGHSRIACLCLKQFDKRHSDDDKLGCFKSKMLSCIEKHERGHGDVTDCSKNKPGMIRSPYKAPELWKDPKCGGVCSECWEYTLDIGCISAINCSACGDEAACRLAKDEWLRDRTEGMKRNCTACKACNQSRKR